MHIGTHRTGSTSTQNFFSEHHRQLQHANIVFFKSPRGKPNFKELFHLSLDPQRQDMFRVRPLKHPRIIAWHQTKWHIAATLRNNPGQSCLCSSELLSWLRTSEEIDRLRSLFPTNCMFSVVVCLRRPEDYLGSYARHLTEKEMGISKKQGNFNYVDADSWLVDYKGLIDAYRILADDIRVVDYQASIEQYGNIIPAVCQSIGVNVSLLETHDFPFLNKNMRAHRTVATEDIDR